MDHIAPMLVCLDIILASAVLGMVVAYLIKAVQCWRWNRRR